jgi:hypothetical protein
MVRHVFGQHMPMRLKMEMAITSRPLRLGALPSSNIHAEVLSNKDTTIEIEEYLNRMYSTLLDTQSVVLLVG